MKDPAMYADPAIVLAMEEQIGSLPAPALLGLIGDLIGMRERGEGDLGDMLRLAIDCLRERALGVPCRSQPV